TNTTIVSQIIPVNRTYAPIQAFVDELRRCGLAHAVTCPGSRNAPLILTLAGQEGIEAISAIDERAAGFLALGLAKASGKPVAVTCTSGTAAANLHPAVVEAHEARVPLIVLTADRPPELRDVGAGQAIDQQRLYGSAAKWFVEVGNHEPGRDSAVHHRALACRAWWTAAGGRPGPVQLNFPLRDPLAPVEEELDAGPWQGRADGRPWVELREHSSAPDANDVQRLADRIAATPRGAIVCGPTREDVGETVARLAGEVGWPVLAEPTSGLRCGGHDRSQVVAHYDVLLRVQAFTQEHLPALVLRVGDTPTSKPLRELLARTEQVILDPDAAWHEPTRSAGLLLHAAAAPACDALAGALEMRTSEREPGWIESWRRADSAVPEALAGAPDPFEPKALAAVEPALPDGAVVWVGSSMPIRDLEAYFPQSEKPIRFLANRGANGIDGVAASAAGAALAHGGRGWLLTGELGLLHDLGGLLAAGRAGAELTVVCLDNGGGAIFDFLPVAAEADRELYERHIATPAGVDLERVASLAGLGYTEAATDDEVAAAAAEPGLVVVRSDRADNVRLHRELVERVAAVIS
ncbi:MAG: 2-succinyl-5-enolpyruvyl-6-hydroxy-3-cyclohexene-1-carboxylic-acid synthase, partial [Thermoleophilaceae bacterium]